MDAVKTVVWKPMWANGADADHKAMLANLIELYVDKSGVSETWFYAVNETEFGERDSLEAAQAAAESKAREILKQALAELGPD